MVVLGQGKVQERWENRGGRFRQGYSKCKSPEARLNMVAPPGLCICWSSFHPSWRAPTHPSKPHAGTPSPNCRSAVNDHLLFALVFSTSHLSRSPVVFPQHVTHLAITALGTCVAIVHVFSGFFYLRNSLERARLYQILGRKCSFKFEVVHWNALPPP